MEIKPALYLNMILAEQEPVEVVKRSIDSVKDFVDGMYITVTYNHKKPSSHHALIQLLNSYDVHVSYFKWVKDFAKARQYALDQVPRGEHIFIYWQDADDVLKGADWLPKYRDEMYANHLSAIYLNYWYQVELDEQGEVREVLVEHKRERIVRNDDTWHWVGPLHEILVEQKQENLIRIPRTEATVVHLNDVHRFEDTLMRNIEILENTIKDQNERDPRTLVYLAKAYFDKAKMVKETERDPYITKALNLFNKYLNGQGTPGTEKYLEPSGWSEERSTAWCNIGDIFMLKNKPELAVKAYQSAMDEAPEFPNYVINLAMAYVYAGDYKKAKHWLLLGTHIPEPNTTIITFPKEIKTRALEVSFEINMHEMRLDLAEKNLKELIDLCPNDESLKTRLQTVHSINVFNKACQSVVFLGKYLEQLHEEDKIPHLIQAMTNDMQKEKFAAEMRHKFMPIKKWESNEVTILCGPGWEQWSPQSLQKGLGGSEEAVVYLSQELTKLGWKVTVYANPGKEAGNYDGVEYKMWYDLNPKDEFNILILWRTIGFMDIQPKAKFTMVWMHDVPNNPDFTEDRLEKVNKIAVLSEYHKSLLRMYKNGEFVPMPEEKVFLTGNGIPDMDITTWKGNPQRMIYMSSPDRGLVYLLRHWGEIRQAVPNAELHVFYGFDVFDAIHRNNPAKKEWKERIIQMMQQPGIIYHGRIGHKALEKEINLSGIWAYPTDFTEISCISAMKCQALGAVPVTTNLAALEETVKCGVRVDVDITEPEGQEEYFKTLIDYLKHPEKQAEIRKDMMIWAKEYYHWKTVAGNWSQLFKTVIN